MTIKTVVRVGTSNNFNCTAEEYAQLDYFAAEHPDSRFFVNCNARTPELKSIPDYPWDAVITLNPDLTPVEFVTKRALQVGHAGKVSFYRVKWLPGRPDIEALIDRALEVAPVVITSQRFNSQ